MEIAIAGGHGKVGRRLARLLVARGDGVKALIRNPDHAEEVRADGGEPVLCDLEAATVDEVAAAIGGCDAVVFAAGAGPGSGVERKWSMDRDGAVRLLRGAEKAAVGGYLMVSSLGAGDPPEGDDVFSVYLRAKGEADQALVESDREWVVLRPASLTDDPGSGRVEIGPDPLQGEVGRDDVAAVLAALVGDHRAARRVIYLRSGETPIADALAALGGGEGR